MRFWPFGSGTRQVINESDRIIELRTRIVLTAVIVGTIQAIILFILLMISLIYRPFSAFIIKHPIGFIVVLLLPIPIGLFALLWVNVRDLADPNWEPINMPLARARPLMPWRKPEILNLSKGNEQKPTTITQQIVNVGASFWNAFRERN